MTGPLQNRILHHLKAAPCTTRGIAQALEKDEESVRRSLNTLATKRLVCSWFYTYSSPDIGPITMRVWRLTTPTEQKTGRPNPNEFAKNADTINAAIELRIHRLRTALDLEREVFKARWPRTNQAQEGGKH